MEIVRKRVREDAQKTVKVVVPVLVTKFSYSKLGDGEIPLFKGLGI